MGLFQRINHNSGSVIAILTAALVGVGYMQAVIYGRQADINSRQLEISMNDQRGWIKAVPKFDKTNPDIRDSWAAENRPVSVLFTFTNTGKTPHLPS